VSGPLLCADAKIWLRLIPLLALIDDTGIASHGLPRCSVEVRKFHFR
jgi:hypothetical protein